MTTAETANCHICFIVLSLYTAVGDPVANSVKKFAVPAIHTHTQKLYQLCSQVNLDNKIRD